MTDRYCSSSVAMHLVRGVAALAALVGAILLARHSAPLAVLCVIAAFVLMRGCPLCWIEGLIGTWRRSRARRL